MQTQWLRRHTRHKIPDMTRKIPMQTANSETAPTIKLLQDSTYKSR